MNKYEMSIMDYHGHFSTDRFEADSDDEARKIAREHWYGHYTRSLDSLWRVEGDYVDDSHFDEHEREKMKNNYIEIHV